MERYRKSDQHYIDEYDRDTISMLKELEQRAAFLARQPATAGATFQLKLESETSLYSLYHNGVLRARNKGDTIRSRIQSDENQDRLVARYPEPQNVRCKTCNSLMVLCTHLFKEGEAEILFVFKCPNRHAPKRAIYPNGREFSFPTRRCRKCGEQLKSKSRKELSRLTFIESCTKCGEQEITEYDLTPDEYQPIDEQDRDKYCNAYVNKRTVWEGLESLAHLFQSIEESKRSKAEAEAEAYGFDAIDRINIPQLEKRVSDLLAENAFTKTSFENPDLKKQVIIGFSVQDPTDRLEKDSLKEIKKLLEKDLFQTNWRLMKTDLTYRMGYITGKLKGAEHDDDLIKIAKEIHEKAKQEFK